MTGSSSDAKVMASSEGNLSEKERARQLDGILGFGNYQWFQVNVYKYNRNYQRFGLGKHHSGGFWFQNYLLFQVWVLQTLIAIIGAINYYHIVFLVSDPPDWECADKDAEK